MQADSEQEQVQQKNPIKRAEKEKEFRTAGQRKQVYTIANELYTTANQLDKTFKMVKNEHPRHHQTYIIDFSLNARGFEEDQIYTRQEFYRKNIRRGNTFVYDAKKKQAFWGRKGLIKFFDISQSALKAISEDDILNLSKKDKANYYCVFSEIENVLSCNEELQPKDKAKVHVYRLNKANGQNAQVTYFAPFDEWVVSSKNVSIFVKTPEQMNNYKGDRYQFAILIGKAWFQLLKQKNKGQIEELKKDLADKTIIGEYCGNPDYQHLVKYAHTTIFFYAAVEKESSQSCILPNRTFQILQKHHLPIVKNHDKSYLGQFTEFPLLGKALLQVFKQVSTASIFEEEEGSVVYFAIQKPKVYCEYISDRYLQKTVPIPDNWQERQAWWKVTSLGKLKTLQYRILRKLREKLKFFTRQKRGGEQNKQKKENDLKKVQQKYGSFEKQVYQLIKNQKLSKPIEYYFCAGLLSFEYGLKHKKSKKGLQTMSEHYLDFLSVIFWCMQNKRPVTEELMRDENLIKQLRGQTWENYSIEIVKEYPELLERIAPKYAKIKKTKNIEDLEEEKDEKEGVMQQDD